MANLLGAQAAHRSPAQFAQALNPDEIVATRRSQSRVTSKNTNCTGFPYPLDRPVVFVKYGERSHYRESEARTQQFAFEAVENMPLADREGIHVPEVYRVFTVRSSTYIIMEYVPGRTLREIMDEESDFDKVSSQLYDKILRGIQLLLSIPAPKDAAPGPYGGGIIRHPLFKDYTAAIEYDSVEMLEKHINKVCTIRVKTAPTVKLERELHLCFSDLYEGNFMFTASGDLYLVDFEQVSFLPLTFMTYAAIQRWRMCGVVRQRLDLPEENLPAMKLACTYFVMSITRLGLPLDDTGDVRKARGREAEGYAHICIAVEPILLICIDVFKAQRQT